MSAPYRADQVGSLLRPAALLEARAAHAEGRLDLGALRAVEDRAIEEALERQRQTGIDVVTDGEFRRYLFFSDLVDAVEGFVPNEETTVEWHGPGGGGPTRLVGPVVGAKLHQTRPLTAHEVAFLKTRATGPYKITVPSPQQFIRFSYRPGLTDRFYPTRADLVQELTGIIRREIEALIADGVPYIQVDSPWYNSFVDAQQRARLQQEGVDVERLLDEAIAADNALVAGLGREGVTLALHVCRGNSRSRWLAEGGYEPIAEKLFNGLAYDRFLLEYDTERAGGFEPLRFVPPGKDVVLGLVTTKEGRLESPEALLQRIDAAARYVAMDHLALSPQCGFASVATGNLLSMDDQWRKLELVAETARRAWG
jgi:5-methyltetrahydropteroyltriglutamate--homocysteine methyltransferase